jgi:hypothetical protein
MRLADNNVVLISVSVETIKIFISPFGATDVSQFIELKSLTIKNAQQRLSLMTPKEKIAEDLSLLEQLRKAISWPDSLDTLIINLNKIPDTI